MTRIEFLRKNCIPSAEKSIEIHSEHNPSELLTQKFISLRVSDNEVVELYKSPNYKGMYYVYVLNELTRMQTHREIFGRVILTRNKFNELYMCG